MPTLKRPIRSHIFAFAPNEWHGPWLNRQQFLSRLARRGWPVVYSTGALSTWQRGSAAWRAAGIFSRWEDHDGVRVDRPGKALLRWQRVKPFDVCAIFGHTVSLSRRSGVRRSKSIAYVFHPSFYCYATVGNFGRVLYHAYDVYEDQPGWTRELAQWQKHLVLRADRVVASSKSVLERLGHEAWKKGTVICNGADVAAFSRGPTLPCPADLDWIPHPRVGYVGRINRKIDFNAIATVAQRRPEWHWVIVGPVQEGGLGGADIDPVVGPGYRACRRLTNVHFLGAKHHTDLPAYVGHMTVNTICYRNDRGWWEAAVPLKLYEYLAAGRPVVSCILPEISNLSGAVSFASTTDEWEAAIAAAIAENSDSAIKRRQSIAAANSWDERVDRLERVLDALLA